MKYLSFNYILFFCFLGTCVACNSSKENAKNSSVDKTTTYKYLSVDNLIKNHLGQQVWLEGKETISEYQHMMKSSFSIEGEAEEKHIYVTYNDGKEVVIYYKNINIPKDKKIHTFYGTVQSISGAGKSGGTHTEYYLDLDEVK